MTIYDDGMRRAEHDELEALRRYHAKTARALAEATAVLERVDAQRAELNRLKSEREVIVRTAPGPALTVFHDPKYHCDRVYDSAIKRGAYRRVFESVARADGLRACPKCERLRNERERDELLDSN